MELTRRTVLSMAPMLTAQVPGPKPNIIWIGVDTWGASWMGCYGGARAKTPNVDKLAARAVVFEDAYAEALPTLPARRALYTGRRVFPSNLYPQPDDQVRIRGWHPMYAEDVTISETLRGAGYTTALISDLYHQFKPGKNFHRGFDCWRWIRGQESDRLESGPRSAIDLSKYMHPSQPANPRSGVMQFLLNRRSWKTADDFLAAQVFRSAGQWLESSAQESQPFYLHIESFSPHEFWDPPEEYYRMYMKSNYRGPRLIQPPPTTEKMTPVEVEHAVALYSGLVTFVDHCIGRFLDKVEAMGLLKNTIIVLAGDHGTMMGEQGQLHKGEQRLRTQCTRVPIMIADPRLDQRPRIKGFVQHIDLMPTLLDLVGVTAPARVTGKSLKPLIASGTGSRRDWIVTGWGEHGSVRTPEWLYIGRWSPGPPFEQLYDVRRDPEELHNVAAEHPAAVKESRARLKDYVEGGWPVTRGGFTPAV